MSYQQERATHLARELAKRGVDEASILSLISSGYGLIDVQYIGSEKPIQCVYDSFYGSKMHIGLTPVDEFLTNKTRKIELPEFEASSMDDVVVHLTSADHRRRLLAAGQLSFRGQPAEYFTKRTYPNPAMSLADGRERLILPSYWRQFKDDWLQRFLKPYPGSIFSTWFGDEFVYHGIPDWKTLSHRNLEKHGPHSLSDLEDFDDWESREYHKRWWAFKVAGNSNTELSLIEQHYGLPTPGLDVTFDIRVAVFFALHRFVIESDGLATYRRHRQPSTLYVFCFRDPQLKSTSDLVTEVPSFAHIQPTRPLLQRCALPFFHESNINESVADLECVIRLGADFDMAGVPRMHQLFPSEQADPFYAVALKLKRSNPESQHLSQFVEYAVQRDA